MRSTPRQLPSRRDASVDVETNYLDLDGDGVPDAVQVVEAVAVDLTGDGHVDFVELVEEVASDIGVDGVPGTVEVVEQAEIELEAIRGARAGVWTLRGRAPSAWTGSRRQSAT